MYISWQPITLLTLAMVVFATVAIFIMQASFEDKRSNVLLCDASGTVQEVAEDYDATWQMGSYFSINMPVLTGLGYTRAKVFDVFWDLAFGRGGQILVGMVAYRVTRHSFRFSMERSAFPISTATFILSQQQIQALSIWEMTRVLTNRLEKKPVPRKDHILETRLRVLACIFLCTYVLSFATLTSVMTGYFSAVEGVYGSVTDNEPMKSLSQFSRADLLLLDSDRLSLSDEAIIGMMNQTNQTSMENPIHNILLECE